MSEESEIITKANKLIEDFNNKLKLKPVFHENLVDGYLSAGQDKMQKMTPEECAEASLLLSQYSLFIQKELNYHQSITNLCNSIISSVVASTVNQYKGYSYEERKHQAIKDNDVANKLLKTKNESELLLNNLQYIPQRIENISQKYNGLSMSKRSKQ